MGKVYAVKKGFKTGKFYDWETCKAQVNGYKGAEYKSFSGATAEQQADAYLGVYYGSSVLVLEPIGQKSADYMSFEPYDNPYNCTEDTCIAFVDGSYDKKTTRFAFGAVLFTKDAKYCLCGCDDTPYLSPMRNVSGELLGAMMAVLKAESLGMKKIMIVHDYEGVAEWVATDHKPWQTNKRGTFEYVEFISNHRANIDIAFKWVKGHSGVEHNEEADKLASKAIKEDIRCDASSVFADFDSQ